MTSADEPGSGSGSDSGSGDALNERDEEGQKILDLMSTIPYKEGKWNTVSSIFPWKIGAGSYYTLTLPVGNYKANLPNRNFRERHVYFGKK